MRPLTSILPSPARRITRATELLRLPVAWIEASAGTATTARLRHLVVVVVGRGGLAGGALLFLGLAARPAPRRSARAPR